MLIEHIANDERVELAVRRRLEGQQQALLKQFYWTLEEEGGEKESTGEVISFWATPGRSIAEWTLPGAYAINHDTLRTRL
jgi:hypothetical protein